jgi:hypothetical protein
MNAFLSKLSNPKRSTIFIGFILVLAIVFETSQQLFYIRRFNLSSDVTFIELLKTQAYRWIIWMILGFTLIWFVKLNVSKKLSSKLILNYGVFILALVLVNIVVISFSQLVLSNEVFSSSSFVREYIQFFTFQKAPIYCLGYIAITIILHLYFSNEQLHIKVQELSELKKSNAILYNELVKNIDDKASILNIKIGNRRKIIPTANIRWIEADDYCVKVHTINEDTYTMRSSLKALEEKLTTNFLRVHRKAIVNMSMAKELNLSHTPNLVLNNNEQVNVSKSNLKTVKNYFS